MSKKIVITGASSGIGKATALFFAEKGWKVAATMRTPEKETDLQKNDNINVYKLDVTSQDSIEAAYKEIIEDFGQVDVLLNNAGYALYGPFEVSESQQIRAEFDVNVFGLMDMIKTFLPHFRANKSGTIVNISSMGGKITLPLVSTYLSTKFAVEGFVESILYELEPLGIKVKLIEPGLIATDFGGRSMQMASSEEVTDYNAYIQKTMEVRSKFNTHEIGRPEMVAKTIFESVTDGTDQLRYVVGADAKELIDYREKNGDEAFVKFTREMYQ